MPTPVITFTPVPSDDAFINAVESLLPLTLAGTATNVADGNTLTIMLNGAPYTAIVTGGAWTLDVPPAAVTALADGTYTLAASVSELTGDLGLVGTQDFDIAVDTTAPTITFDAVPPVDDAIDAAGFEITGTIVAPFTDIVGNSFEVEILDLNDVVLTTVTATINPATGIWTADVPADSFDFDSIYNLHVKDGTAVDAAGNPATAVDELFNVNDTDPGIQIQTIAGDDIIDGVELTGNLNINFFYDVDLITIPAGNTVTITIGTLTKTIPQSSGSNSVTFSNSEIAAAGGLPDGDYNVVAVVNNAAGDVIATNTHPVVVDSASEAPTLNIEGADLTINANEAVGDVELSGNAEPGAVVSLTLESISGLSGNPVVVTTASVTAGADGSWTALIPAGLLTQTTTGIDDTGTFSVYRVTATAVDVAGNPASAPVTLDFEVDLDGVASADAATITIDNNVAGNDKVDAAEALNPVTISGTTNHVEAGQTVTITLGTGTYSAVVVADPALTTGTWTVDVPAADIAALGNGAHDIAVSVLDAAGNTSLVVGEEGEPIAKDTQSLAVDLDGPAIGIDVISDDDFIDAFDGGTVTVTGTTLNVEAGQVVTVNANGVVPAGDHTALVQADGTWSVNINGTQFLTSTPVTADVDDAAGDAADTASHDVTKDNLTDAVDISGIDANNDGDDNPLTGSSLDTDTIINAAESGAPITVYGTSISMLIGDHVTVSINNIDYDALVTTAGGEWSVEIPAADVAALPNGDVPISAAPATPYSATVPAPVDILTVDKQGDASIAIDQIAFDDILTADEIGTSQFITGTSTGLAAGAPVTVTINGTAYTLITLPNPTIPGDPGAPSLIGFGGSWAVEIPAADLAALVDGPLDVTVSTFLGSDPVTATRPITVDIGNDPLETTAGDDNVTGTSGDDTIDGLGGDDILVGGLGNDDLTGGAGDDYLYGQDGDDVLNSGGGGADVDVLVGGAGNDELNGDEGFSYLYGGAGQDTANGGSGTDIAYGGDDNDTLNGNGGTDWLFGEVGNDDLNGGAESDLLFGGQGDDIINGGSGNDWLWGDDADATGGGADTFVFDANWGVDVIYDFENGVDTIDLSGTGLAFTDLNIGQIAGGFTYVADDTFTNFIYLDGGSSPLDATDLGAEDFLF